MDTQLQWTIGLTLLCSLATPTAIAFVIFRLETRRANRERAVQLLLRYDSQEMQDKRVVAWRYLGEQGSDVPPLEQHYAVDATDEMIAVKDGLWSVLAFHQLLNVLSEERAVDVRVVRRMLGDSIEQWADQCQALRGASRENPQMFVWMDNLLPRTSPVPAVREAVR